MVTGRHLHEPATGGDGVGVPLLAQGAGIGAAQCLLQECHGGCSVRHRMVHLGHHGEPVVGQSLHHHDLPQRPVPAQWPAGHVGDDRGQLTVAARWGDAAAADVASQVEVRVLHPHRVAEPERHRHGPAPERGEPVEAAAEELQDLLVGDRAAEGGGVEHCHLQGVHVGRGRFGVEELGVEPDHRLHRSALGAGWGGDPRGQQGLDQEGLHLP